MDNKSLEQIIKNIPILRYKYQGSFPANQIPPIPTNTFVIVNIDPINLEGSHWIMLANKNGGIYYGDSMGLPLTHYKNIRLPFKNKAVRQLVRYPMQKQPLCGLYCIYFAWSVFKELTIPTFFNDFNLMRFIYSYM